MGELRWFQKEFRHISTRWKLISFSIKVKYEYAALDETDTDKIDNAFTWIWITLECNLCHTKYKNFISYETGQCIQNEFTYEIYANYMN